MESHQSTHLSQMDFPIIITLDNSISIIRDVWSYLAHLTSMSAL